MSTIRLKTTPIKIGEWTILRLPESASAKLPSRGMALVEGTLAKTGKEIFESNS